MSTFGKGIATLALLALGVVAFAQARETTVLEEEVSIVAGDAVYSGTLSLPSQAGVHPLVILVSGMGPQDRDWSMASGKYKMAKIMADYLNRNGIAVYRYDDRGFGKSTGTAEGLTSFDDLARDLETMVARFRARKDIGKIGLSGHSLGGILSVIAGARGKDIDFVITLSGPFRSGADIMREQARTLKRWRTSAQMSDAEVVDQGLRFTDCLVSYAKDGSGGDAIRQILVDLVTFQIGNLSAQKMAENLKTYRDKEDLLEKSVAEAFAFYTSSHQKSFVSYSAADDLPKIGCPVLVLFGENDRNVVVESNRPAVAAALANARTLDFTLRVIPGADHGYSNAALYAKGEMSPGLLGFMAAWILSKTSPQYY